MPLGPRANEGARLEIALLETDGLTPDESNQTRLIRDLYTEPECRRRGDARYLLCEVCVEADRERAVLVLEPKPGDDGPLDAEALELFYRRFGFIVGQREPMVLMVRAPRKVG